MEEKVKLILEQRSKLANPGHEAKFEVLEIRHDNQRRVYKVINKNPLNPSSNSSFTVEFKDEEVEIIYNYLLNIDLSVSKEVSDMEEKEVVESETNLFDLCTQIANILGKRKFEGLLPRITIEAGSYEYENYKSICGATNKETSNEATLEVNEDHSKETT